MKCKRKMQMTQLNIVHLGKPLQLKARMMRTHSQRGNLNIDFVPNMADMMLVSMKYMLKMLLLRTGLPHTRSTQ